MGAFAGLGMGLNGVFTAFAAPVLSPLGARRLLYWNFPYPSRGACRNVCL